MGEPSTHRLVRVLHKALRGVEEEEADPNGRALDHLKHQLLQSIAELEVRKESGHSDYAETPVVLLRVRRG
jgi:hypothetical protein